MLTEIKNKIDIAMDWYNDQNIYTQAACLSTLFIFFCIIAIFLLILFIIMAVKWPVLTMIITVFGATYFMFYTVLKGNGTPNG